MGQLVHQNNIEPVPSPSRHARRVIGARRLAEICGLTTEAIRKWDRPLSKGGTGGLIPARYQSVILETADREGLPIRSRDLIAEAQL